MEDGGQRGCRRQQDGADAADGGAHDRRIRDDGSAGLRACFGAR
jgi:hypothetical protein